MKRTIIVILILVMTFTSCGYMAYTSPEEPEVYEKVDEMELLEFLQSNISTENSVDEIIDTFEKMCETPVYDDLLLLEYGVYGFTGEDLFYFDLVRQFPDGNGEYYQLRVSLTFAPDEENRRLSGTVWSDMILGDFFDHIRKKSGYKYAKDHEIKSIDIRIDQT